MFSAVDGFRFSGSGSLTTYVAIYSDGNARTSGQIVLQNDGNVFVSGTQTNPPVIYTDYNGYIKKQISINPDANMTPQNNKVLLVDSDGEVIIGGVGYNANTYNDGMLMKLDSNLQPVWQTVIVTGNTTNTEAFISGALDSSDNIFACGVVDVPGGGYGNSILAKYDNNGNLIFSKTFAGQPEMTTLTIDTSGNVYTLGLENSVPSSLGVNFYKYDNNGNYIWGYTHNPPSNIGDTRRLNYIDTDSNNNAIMTIEDSLSGPNGFINNYVTKFYSNGVQAWTKSATNTSNALVSVSLNQITTDGSNIYFVADIAGADIVFVKTDDTGNKVWERTLTPLGNVTYPTVTEMTWANGYIATVGTTGNPSNDGISVIKINDDGSGEGTYGNYTYANTNIIALNTSTLLFSGVGDISSNYTLTTNTSSFTSNSVLYTTTINAL
jgi:hypothetical protein